ncbi:single-stranded DNA-binding protein [Dyadobacter sp. CY323]|uniref:single-stranded DNA-binding protein n=1 Tax=Dyadobacter sp. CY323 TaxID=2907302 RepID=UPI001F2FD9F5|nr:single-stranded DNA-binding protein [Dyadobacter sp. CY323]MCE6993104.1 single-stranded DNA-binding protein [Dyadobacter sp. CY323]
MSQSLNRVTLIGHLGKDPDIRTTQNNSRVASFSLATSESWNDKASGDRKENTQWHRIVVFNENLIGIIEKYLKKGSKVYLEGQLESRKWTGDDGKENNTTEIVLRQYRGEILLLDGKSDNQDASPSHVNDVPEF